MTQKYLYLVEENVGKKITCDCQEEKVSHHLFRSGAFNDASKTKKNDKLVEPIFNSSLRIKLFMNG